MKCHHTVNVATQSRHSVLWFQLFVVAFISISFSQKSYAHHGGLEFCNETNHDINFAVASQRGLAIFGKVWTLDAWYRVDMGKCITFYKSMSDIYKALIGVTIARSKSNGPRPFPGVKFKTTRNIGESDDVSLCVRWNDITEKRGTLSKLGRCSADEDPLRFTMFLKIPAVPIGQNYSNVVTFKPSTDPSVGSKLPTAKTKEKGFLESLKEASDALKKKKLALEQEKLRNQTSQDPLVGSDKKSGLESMTSSTPFLIRAIYEWIIDNELTPYLQVDATKDGVSVPRSFVEDGLIILNISPEATKKLELGDKVITFIARFNDNPIDIIVPVTSVTAVYARENGQGMKFAE